MCQQYVIVPLEVAHPQSISSSSTWFLVELECYLEMMVFEERGKLEYPEKNLWEQRREPTTNSTHICRRRRVWTWAMLVEASALTTAPSLASHPVFFCLTQLYSRSCPIYSWILPYERCVNSLFTGCPEAVVVWKMSFSKGIVENQSS